MNVHDLAFALFARDDDHSHMHSHAEGDSGSDSASGSAGGLSFPVIVYVLLTFLSMALLYPLALVFGLATRLYIPLNILAAGTMIGAWVLSWFFGSDTFGSYNIHGRYELFTLIPVIAVQLFMGFVMVTRPNKGFLAKVGAYASKVFWLLAFLMPILGWIELAFLTIDLLGWCKADHLGQCLAHGIMGSSFVFYGYVLVIMLFFGEKWLQRANKSQEFYDNLVIMLWGMVNTFTEHRWGQPWSHGDFQHTSMGIIWWCAGLVGLLLSYDWVLKKPRRNHIPALVLIFTGYAMSQHTQNLMISTKVHLFFGYALMAAGLTRIIEISFVVNDEAHQGQLIKAWQYLPPLLLVESGTLFMGATEEQMMVLDNAGIMHASYILVLSSIAFLLFLWILGLVNLYVVLKNRSPNKETAAAEYVAASTAEPGFEMRPFLEDEEDDMEL